MALPEPGQSTIQPLGEKEETTVAAAPVAPAPPVVEDAGHFAIPTVPKEVAHVVTPVANTPPVVIPPDVSHVGEGTPVTTAPVTTGQEAAPTAPPKNVMPFSFTGWRLAKDVKSWRYYDAEKRRKRGQEQVKMSKAA